MIRITIFLIFTAVNVSSPSLYAMFNNMPGRASATHILSLFKTLFMSKSHGTGKGPSQIIITPASTKITFNSPFIQAAADGDLPLIQRYISNNTDINLQDNNGYTALMATARYDRPNIGAVLILAGAELTVRNHKSGTPLMIAAQFNADRIAKLLVDAGAPVNMQSVKGVTALIVAARYGHVKIVKILLKNSSTDINLQTSDNISALRIAAENDHDFVVRLLLAEDRLDLLQFGTDYDRFYKWVNGLQNQTIKNLIINREQLKHAQLFNAVTQKNLSQVKKLIEQLKDIEVFNANGDNLLHIAIKNIPNINPEIENRTLLFLLLSTNRELLFHENKLGITPLDLAVNKPQILDLFFDMAYPAK